MLVPAAGVEEGLSAMSFWVLPRGVMAAVALQAVDGAARMG